MRLVKQRGREAGPRRAPLGERVRRDLHRAGPVARVAHGGEERAAGRARPGSCGAAATASPPTRASIVPISPQGGRPPRASPAPGTPRWSCRSSRSPPPPPGRAPGGRPARRRPAAIPSARVGDDRLGHGHVQPPLDHHRRGAARDAPRATKSCPSAVAPRRAQNSAPGPGLVGAVDDRGDGCARSLVRRPRRRADDPPSGTALDQLLEGHAGPEPTRGRRTAIRGRCSAFAGRMRRCPRRRGPPPRRRSRRPPGSSTTTEITSRGWFGRDVARRTTTCRAAAAVLARLRVELVGGAGLARHLVALDLGQAAGAVRRDHAAQHRC